jgi:hypothetical protein
MRRTPKDTPETFDVPPLTTPAAPLILTRDRGRPKKNGMPPMPSLQISDLEQQMLDSFISGYLREYPDLTESDKFILQLAGLEYINYHRVLAQELESGKIISMARQAPYTPFYAALDRLSVTRRERVKKDGPNAASKAAQEDIRRLFS